MLTMHIDVPDNIRDICSRLERAGYPTYVVGGCVRDSVLGTVPHDWDITTAALPDEVAAIFHVSPLDNAKAHGVSFVHQHGGEDIEVATFRKDGRYDGHNCEVSIGGVDIHEDLARRDFTINAMAYRPLDGEFIDDYDGAGDICKGVIRCVGDAGRRISEDPLRSLRAVRFGSKYGFDIEPDVVRAIHDHSSDINSISRERQRDELVKILMTDHVRQAFNQMHDTGILGHIMPDFCNEFGCEQHNPNHMYDVVQHSLVSVEEAPADETVRLALLLHDYGKVSCRTTDDSGIDHFYGHAEASAEYAASFMSDFRFTKKQSEDVCMLIRYHETGFESDKTIRKFANRHGYDAFRTLCDVRRADIMAQADYGRAEKLNDLNERLERARKLEEAVPAFSVSDMAINGHDVMAMGVSGRRIGEVIKYCYDRVCDDPSCNTRERLTEISEEYLHTPVKTDSARRGLDTGLDIHPDDDTPAFAE